MSHRPLVFVTGLAVGDYLLWNWSLNGNHDVLALVSGLTLPPLAVAWLWLLAMSVARLIARSARRSSGRAGRRGGETRREQPQRTAAPGLPLDEPPTSNAPAGRSSRKLAA
ncbi:MAG: hypothetical protein ACLPUT_19220 [Solirubrobacteraceae bacterium]